MSEMGKTTNGDKPATQAMLKDGLAELKTDLRSEMADMKTELRSEMAGMKKELKSDIARVAVGLVKTQERLQRVEENMFTKADGRAIIATIDGLTKGLASYEYRMAVRKHQLNDHERRIRTLEKQPRA